MDKINRSKKEYKHYRNATYDVLMTDMINKQDELVEWVNSISERIGKMEDEYKQHLYGGSSGLENIMPTGMERDK